MARRLVLRWEAAARGLDSPERLWREYGKDLIQWWENRRLKRISTGPASRQAASGEGFWIHGHLTQIWGLAKLKSWQELKAGVSRAYWAAGLASGDRSTTSVNTLQQSYLKDPVDWLDNRRNKLHLKSHENAADLKAPERSEYSWRGLILQYTKCGQGRQALRMYEEMQKDGVEPSPRTFVALLKACSSLQDLESGKRIHAAVNSCGFESDLYVGTMLVDMYAKCGSLVDARLAFEKMSRRDVVSWNAMILAYAQMDEGEEALQLYMRMQQVGVVGSDRTYVSALKACSSLAESGEKNGGDAMDVRKRCLETVRAIHRDIVKGKFESDVFVGNILVDAYAKCGSVEDARLVFDNMCDRTVVSWTAMIMGYAQVDKGKEALQLYTCMEHEGVVPNGRTYVAALKACTSLVENEPDVKQKCLETVRAVHSDIVKGKFETDVFVGNMLVDAYAKCGSLYDARRMFEKMPDRSVVSWNAIILGSAQMNRGEDALQLYIQMKREGVVPDDRTYVSALKACSSLSESGDRKAGADIAMKQRCLDSVRAIHADIMKGKFESSVFVGTMLVDGYAKCGSLEDARRVFQKMSRRDAVSWTAMISGYAHMGKGEEALQLYTQMQQEGVVPDGWTYVGALNACGTVADLGKGKEIHAQIWNAGLEVQKDFFLPESLIDMYGKCGSMVHARQVFDAMPTRDVVAWNALIAGYAHQGQSEVVFDLFHRMKQEGLQPNGITFLGVLTVCSNVGLVDRGQEHFVAMTRDYGITPTVQHYTCLVDLLGRAGHLFKAMEIARDTPFEADRALWGCLLGACRKWSNVELGRQAFECAVRLDNSDSKAYVMMSNIYAAAHMQEEAKDMQARRVKSRAWKQPGWSRWTDLSGVTHVFVVGDREHLETQNIQEKLRDLLVKMRDGCLPNLDSVRADIPDEEDALSGHSEKLAIACALLTRHLMHN